MGHSHWRDGRQAWQRLSQWWERPVDAVAGRSDEPLDALADVRLVRDLLAEAELAAVRTARAQARSWSEIATALGVSRQAAWERWQNLHPAPRADAAVAPVALAALAANRKEEAMPTVEDVWSRIEQHAGEQFHQKKGAPFTYTVYGGCVIPNRTNRQLPRSDFAKALELVPLETTVPLQRLQGPSYIWAILHDPRIRREDW